MFFSKKGKKSTSDIASLGISRTHLSSLSGSQQVQCGWNMLFALDKIIGNATWYNVHIWLSGLIFSTNSIVALYCASKSINSTSNVRPRFLHTSLNSWIITELSLPPENDKHICSNSSSR